MPECVECEVEWSCWFTKDVNGNTIEVYGCPVCRDIVTHLPPIVADEDLAEFHSKPRSSKMPKVIEGVWIGDF